VPSRWRSSTEPRRSSSPTSHEFRTPLTLLLGPLEDAVSRPDPDPALVMAHRNALRLLKHVNTLLEFSRLQAERVKADPRPIDLGTFCGELASMFRSAVEKAGLTLNLDCAPAPVVVIADADQLEQIVLNLLSNALKFTREGGITVRVHESAGRGVVEVCDSGIGIPAQDLDRLFERFHRVEEAWSRSHEGSGIGLARWSRSWGVGVITPPRVRIERVGGAQAVTATLYGDLDLGNRHDVEQALRESVPADVATLVLDLTHVGFLDSSAVQMLFELHRDMERARGHLVLAMSPEATARRSIELSDPGGVLLLHPSSESALESLRA